MALSAAVKIPPAGVAEVLATPALSDSFAYPTNARAVFLTVSNGDTAAHTVTISSHADPEDGLAVSDKVVNVAAGARSLIEVGEAFKNPNTGLVGVTFSAITSVTANPFYL